MAVTVNLDSLRELASFEAENGCAISLYLDLNPSVSPTAGDAATRVNALLDDGLRQAADTHRNLTHEQRQALTGDLERIQAFLREEFNRDGAHGLAVFAARLDNVWKPIPLLDPVPDAIRIASSFFVAPLVPLVGRGDGALVAVVGREQGQLFRLRGGRLQEVADRSEEQPGRHDQGGWSQSRYGRHIEELVGRHLREVAEELDRHVRRLHGARVVIVASEQTRAELDDVLSNETKSALAGWTSAEAHATPAELLEVVRPVLERSRETQEERAIERWREESGRDGRAAGGWRDTLEAASDGRVDQLLYGDGADSSAYVCPKCGRGSAAAGSCPLDGVRMEPHPSALDVAVHLTLRHGGSVLAVRTHHELEPFENVGALLRF